MGFAVATGWSRWRRCQQCRSRRPGRGSRLSLPGRGTCLPRFCFSQNRQVLCRPRFRSRSALRPDRELDGPPSLPAPPARRSQSWWTFLSNHAPEIAAMDLFVVPTLAFNLLYGFIIVRPGSPRAGPHCRDEQPNGRLDCPPDHGGIPLGRCTRLSDPRPRLRLWLDRKAPRLRDGHPGQTDRAPLTMAERFRRAPDWVHPSRMPGPDHCLRRGASAPDSALLRELLQQSSDAPVTQQRRAGASSDSSPRRPKVTSCSRWTTSPIRPNLVFGTDTWTIAHSCIRSMRRGNGAIILTSPSGSRTWSTTCVYRKPHSIEEEGELRKLIG